MSVCRFSDCCFACKTFTNLGVMLHVTKELVTGSVTHGRHAEPGLGTERKLGDWQGPLETSGDSECSWAALSNKGTRDIQGPDRKSQSPATVQLLAPCRVLLLGSDKRQTAVSVPTRVCRAFRARLLSAHIVSLLLLHQSRPRCNTHEALISDRQRASQR